ncbi:equistatin-like [Corticium candelabrum]|uniref:equistatin-like n=1 Tax=Corticium candelabrum TaxID=121492 RepID=UPI002E262B05|nr:equistatin-like [Corticium candelabrum]
MKPTIPDTPCTRRSAEMLKCGDLIGCFVTLCEKDGLFAARQCSPSTGYCWYLNEIDKREETNTALPLSKSLDCTKTPCNQLRSSQTTMCHGLIGCFATSCEPDGSFSSRQCDPSTGYC